MKTQLNTRYIGNVQSWQTFWQEIIDQSLFTRFFGEEDAQLINTKIWQILANVEQNSEFYQTKIAQYPFSLSNSFKDMWLSATVDILEIIFAPYTFDRAEGQSKDGPYYDKMFLNPQHVEQFKQLYQQSSLLSDLELDEYMLEMMLERQQDGFSESAQLENFYHYPIDEYVNPIATTMESLNQLYLVLDGQLEVNGSALFVFADERFADGECEVGLLSYSEATWKRYPTIPEPFLCSLACMFFENEVHSVDDLVIHPLFKQLYQ